MILTASVISLLKVLLGRVIDKVSIEGEWGIMKPIVTQQLLFCTVMTLLSESGNILYQVIL